MLINNYYYYKQKDGNKKINKTNLIIYIPINPIYDFALHKNSKTFSSSVNPSN